jgi:predicted transcriptional regulator
MSTEQDVVHISIRFPSELADAIRRLAKEHDRSINGEVVRAVREYIMRQQKPRKQEGELP